MHHGHSGYGSGNGMRTVHGALRESKRGTPQKTRRQRGNGSLTTLTSPQPQIQQQASTSPTVNPTGLKPEFGLNGFLVKLANAQIPKPGSPSTVLNEFVAGIAQALPTKAGDLSTATLHTLCHLQGKGFVIAWDRLPIHPMPVTTASVFNAVIKLAIETTPAEKTSTEPEADKDAGAPQLAPDSPESPGADSTKLTTCPDSPPIDTDAGTAPALGADDTKTAAAPAATAAKPAAQKKKRRGRMGRHFFALGSTFSVDAVHGSNRIKKSDPFFTELLAG